MYLLSCLFKTISNIVVKRFWRIISKFTIKVTWKPHSITRDVVPVCCDWWIMWPSLFDILNLDRGARVVQWGRSLDLTTHTSLSPIRRGFTPGFVNYKKGALDSQPQVIKFTSCLPMVGDSLRILRLPPPLKLVAMI